MNSSSDDSASAAFVRFRDAGIFDVEARGWRGSIGVVRGVEGEMEKKLLLWKNARITIFIPSNETLRAVRFAELVLRSSQASLRSDRGITLGRFRILVLHSSLRPNVVNSVRHASSFVRPPVSTHPIILQEAETDANGTAAQNSIQWPSKDYALRPREDSDWR